MPSNRFGVPSLLILLGCLAASAADVPAQSFGKVDQKKVHADYNDGNFEKVIASLEGFMASYKACSFEDSVFIAKHLAVVYTANPETREKGKYYMYRLLAMLPSAKLVDMFVSDEIDRIFDKVREEFLARQKSFGVDTAKMSVPAKSPAREEREPRPGPPSGPLMEPHKERAAREDRDRGGGHRAVYLAAGGAAALALGVAAYVALGDKPKATEKTYVVP